MKIIELFEIKELAQEFRHSPKIIKKDKDIVFMYDYETDTGAYKWTGLRFVDALSYKVTPNNRVELYMIDAYNSVTVVKDSNWIKDFESTKDENVVYSHYLVYFDDYGAYEFLAADVIKDDSIGNDYVWLP